jgi:signal transduction histidine kinase
VRTFDNRFFLLAGVGTWLASGAPALWRWARGVESPGLGWLAIFCLFGVAFWLYASGDRPTSAQRLVLLLVQTVCALVLIGIQQRGSPEALLAVVSGQLPSALSYRRGLGWLLAQTAGMAALTFRRSAPIDATLTTLAYGSFEAFAFGAAFLAARQTEARLEVARLHAELLATQSLLADSTRLSERVRIAHELHDSLGHHLTALSLQLEVARNGSPPKSTEALERSAQLAKQLLTEVRQVVGEMKEERALDLLTAARTLVNGIPHPKIHLAVPPDLHIEQPAVAHALFRCLTERKRSRSSTARSPTSFCSTCGCRRSQACKCWKRCARSGWRFRRCCSPPSTTTRSRWRAFAWAPAGFSSRT